MLVFLKTARHEIVRAFRPNLVFRLTVNGNTINDDARARTMFFLTMYLMICVFSTAVVGFLEAGTDISMETCVGCGAGDDFQHRPRIRQRWVPPKTSPICGSRRRCFSAWLMILGRLELFALLVLFFPSAWRKY